MSQAGRYPGQPRNTENSVGRNAFAPSKVQDVSPDNSYQSLITSPGGANVSEDGHTTVIQRNTDNFVRRTGFTQHIQFDVSPDNSYQSSVTSQEGSNVSEDVMDTIISQNTDDSVGRTVYFQKYGLDVSLDNSYQSSGTSHVGANVSGGDADPGLSQNTDDSVGQTGFLQEDGSDVSPDNSYQSSVTIQVGANVSVEDTDPGLPRNTDDSGGEDVDTIISQNTDDSVGQIGFLQKEGSDGSPDNSYQSSVTSQVGANVSVEHTNPGMPRNTDDSGGEGVALLIPQNTNISVGRTGFLQKVESEGSPDNSYQSSVTSQAGAIVTGEKNDIRKPWNTKNSIGVIRFTHTKPSDVVIMKIDNTDREECEGSTISEGEQPLYMRKMDPVPKWTGFTPSKPSDVVYMNIDYDDRPDVEQKSPSSDSGIHSYDDKCTSLSAETQNSDVNPSP